MQHKATESSSHYKDKMNDQSLYMPTGQETMCGLWASKFISEIACHKKVQ